MVGEGSYCSPPLVRRHHKVVPQQHSLASEAASPAPSEERHLIQPVVAAVGLEARRGKDEESAQPTTEYNKTQQAREKQSLYSKEPFLGLGGNGLKKYLSHWCPMVPLDANIEQKARVIALDQKRLQVCLIFATLGKFSLIFVVGDDFGAVDRCYWSISLGWI